MNNIFTGYFPKRGICLVTRLQSSISVANSQASPAEIQIPIRKERGPTDILQALEKTIKRDPTAPRYKYHDDPYLIPLSNLQKRSYALSEESGRRAALWIREQHANLFDHRVADPIIEEFLPKAVYTNKSEVSEDILKRVIKHGHVTDALAIYKLLDEEVSIETKLQLFQLLCYYNNEFPLSEEFVGERWFKNIEKGAKWKFCQDTEKLFEFLKEQDRKTAAEAYSAMICGSSKYFAADKAWRLFDEAQKQNLPLSVNAYNAVIIAIPEVAGGWEERQKALYDLLQKMNNANVKPSSLTLSAALRMTLTIKELKAAVNLCRALFKEFKSLGIKPSLFAYNNALKIFYRKDAAKSSLLNEIIAELKDEKLELLDKNDLFFFINAMEIAASVLEDPMLGDKIHALLTSHDNYRFIGDGFRESIYYRYYLTLQVKNHTLNEFVKNYYDLIVPHLYTPEPSVVESILNAIEANDSESSREFLSKFWTHMVQFGQLERKSLVSKALNLMRTHCMPPKDSPLNAIFAQAGWTVWDFVLNEQERRLQKMTFTGSILCDIAILCYRAKEIDKCETIVSYLYNKRDDVIGTPDSQQIQELFKILLTGCHIDAIIDLVHYCSENSNEDFTSMVMQISSNLSLNEKQENRIQSLLNPRSRDEIKVKKSNSFY